MSLEIPKDIRAVMVEQAGAVCAAGLEMLAIDHSHPETPTRPSNEDIRPAMTPGVAHVDVT